MFDFCSMRILLVAATYREIAPFLSTYPDAHFLITGVGTPSVLYHLTRHLTLNEYDVVLQAGIAGAAPDYKPDSGVVVVARDAFAHSGVWEDDTLFTLQEKGLAQSESWLVNPHKEMIQTLGLPLADAVTVDLIHNHPALLQQVAAKYAAHMESMEGAALHFVCLNEAIPFIQLRAISNVIGDRDKRNWKIDSAIELLNQQIKQVYLTLTNGNA